MNNVTKTNWDLPEQKPDIRTDELTRWEAAIDKVRQIALDQNYTKSKVANNAAIPNGTFSGWYNGTYGKTTHNVTEKIELWLRSVEDAFQVDPRVLVTPRYVETPTSRKIWNTLSEAHQFSELAVVTAAPGLCKTTTAEEYQRRNPNVWIATMHPSCSKVYGMLVEICAVLGIGQNDASKRVRAIGEFFKARNTRCQLIVDEAQNLHDQAIDQLRHFSDRYGVSIIILGNETVYTRWGNVSNSMKDGQFSRRVGRRLRIMKPDRGDVTAILDACGVEDPESRKWLNSIGQRSGSLGHITKTLVRASRLALGQNSELELKHIHAAWKHSTNEDVA